MPEEELKIEGEIEFEGEIKDEPVKAEPAKEEQPKEETKVEEKEEEPKEEAKEEKKVASKEMGLHIVASAKIIKEISNICSTIVNEMKLKVNEKGISTVVVDPSHVAMVQMDIGKEAFEEYHASEFELAIDLDKLTELLKVSTSSDMLTIDYDDESSRLVVQVGNLTRKMALLDTAGVPDPKIPKLLLPAKVVVPAKELSKAIKASGSLSDHMVISVSKEQLEFSAEGDVDTVNMVLSKEDLPVLETKGVYRSIFSLDYLNALLKGNASEITLNLAEDNPVKAEYSFADGNGKVIFLIAPRIESE